MAFDLEQVKCQLRSSAPTDQIDDRDRSVWTQHLKARMRPGQFYRVSKTNQELVLQVLHLQPDKRMYVQRICCLGEDVRTPALVLCVCLTLLNQLIHNP